MKKGLMASLFMAGAMTGMAGGSVIAASGDQVYEAKPQQREITQQQAACYVSCAVAASAWDGQTAGVRQACYRQTDASSTGFMATTRGVKFASPADLPNGVRVVGKVE
jgi:hypothetical protein